MISSSKKIKQRKFIKNDKMPKYTKGLKEHKNLNQGEIANRFNALACMHDETEV
jgi:hypothetical protein